MDAGHFYRNGELVARYSREDMYDWQANPPTVTSTVTDEATGQVVRAETQPVPEPERARRSILADWKTQRAALIDAYSDLQAIAPDMIAANTAVQNANTTAQLGDAIKTYSQTNLGALARLNDAVGATLAMMREMERALGWLDSHLAELAEE